MTVTKTTYSSREVSVHPTHATGIKCSQSAQGHVITIVVLYSKFKVYVMDKTWCEYEPNQTAEYAVNRGLITSKTPVNNGCFIIVAYTELQQAIGPVEGLAH